MQEKEVQEFLEEQNEKIKELYVKIQQAYFKAIISGKQEDYKIYELAALEMEKFFHDKEKFEKIKEFQKNKQENKIEKRQLKLLYDSYLGSQGEWKLIEEIVKKSTEIEKKFNTYRAKINEKEYTENDIKEILKNETNSEKLKEAWEAGKQIGKEVEKAPDVWSGNKDIEKNIEKIQKQAIKNKNINLYQQTNNLLQILRYSKEISALIR